MQSVFGRRDYWRMLNDSRAERRQYVIRISLDNHNFPIILDQHFFCVSPEVDRENYYGKVREQLEKSGVKEHHLKRRLEEINTCLANLGKPALQLVDNDVWTLPFRWSHEIGEAIMLQQDVRPYRVEKSTFGWESSRDDHPDRRNAPADESPPPTGHAGKAGKAGKGDPPAGAGKAGKGDAGKAGKGDKGKGKLKGSASREGSANSDFRQYVDSPKGKDPKGGKSGKGDASSRAKSQGKSASKGSKGDKGGNPSDWSSYNAGRSGKGKKGS